MTQFTNGHALLIGVGADLPITVEDATGVADFLKNPAYCAYPSSQVVLLTSQQARRQAVLSAFDELATAASEEDTVVIYFSGHGYVTELPLIGQTYFLMPYGYDVKNLRQTAIDGREFADKLRAIRAKKILVLLDCCHAGGLDVAQTKSLGATLVKSSMPPESTELLAEGNGYVFIGSSRADELSYAGRPYSVFTYALLEALGGKGVANKDGYVRVTDISQYCAEILPQRTEKRSHGTQHPVLNFENADNFVVAYYAGGETEPKGLPFPELTVEPPEAALQPTGMTFNQENQTVHGNQTNIGSAGNIGQIGDSTTINQSGGVNFHGSGQVSIGGSVVGGDQFNLSGDFRGAQLNIQTLLENVTQTIGRLPHGDVDQRAQVQKLIGELQSELQKVPQHLTQESEKLAERLEALFEEVAEDEPDAAVVGKFGERVKQMAGKIAVALPTVLPLAQKIVEMVKEML